MRIFAVLLLLSACPLHAQSQMYGGIGLIGGPATALVPNDGSTGTTVNLLAKINSSGNAVLAGTGDTAVPVFVVVSGAGTTGGAALAVGGLAVCQFDAAAATIAHFVVASGATGGRCKDAGATAPAAGWVIGQAQTSAAANATATVALSAGYSATTGATAITQLTGDLTATGPGVVAGTLATVNSNVGPCGDSTHAPQVTLNAKGLTTGCTPVLISGGGGAGMFSQLLDYNATNTAGNVQTIGANCSSTTPCQVGVGTAAVCVLTAPATATLTGTSVGSLSDDWWYCSSAGLLTFAHNSASTATCSGCSVATGVTSFPPDSLPMWHTNFTSLAFGAIVSATMDKRAVLRNTVIAAGSGNSSSIDPTTGIQTVSTDPTITPRYFSGAGSPVAAGYTTCTPGRDFYTDKTNLHFYFCDAVNTWKQGDGSGGVDVQNFPLGGYNGSNGYVGGPAYTGSPATWFTNTGPNSIASVKSAIGFKLAVNDYIYVNKTAQPTWSAAAGTVDIILSAANVDGAPAAGSWVLNFYVGCAAPTNGTYSYGTATTVTAFPPNALGAITNYTAAGINLPGSCAAGSPMQLWMQRTADSGGTTGAGVGAFNIQVVIRGN